MYTLGYLEVQIELLLKIVSGFQEILSIFFGANLNR